MPYTIKFSKLSEEHKIKISVALTGRKRPPLSEEWKRKIGEACRGYHHSEEFKERMRHRVFTEEHRRKISEAKVGKPNLSMKLRTGEKNHSWKGGISSIDARIRNSEQGRKWRKSVFERDHFTCQICGEVGGKLNADHIKRFSDFPELRFDLSNGRTLCLEFHRKTDTYGNRKK